MIAGVIMAYPGNPTVLLTGIILTAFPVLLTLATLPVGFDASDRALAWRDRANITNNTEFLMAKDALKWAATTYVVAALPTVVTCYNIYYFFAAAEIEIDQWRIFDNSENSIYKYK